MRTTRSGIYTHNDPRRRIHARVYDFREIYHAAFMHAVHNVQMMKVAHSTRRSALFLSLSLSLFLNLAPRFRSISVALISRHAFLSLSTLPFSTRDRTTSPTFVFTLRISELPKPSSSSTATNRGYLRSEIDRFELRICTGASHFHIQVPTSVPIPSLPVPKPLDS